MKNKLRIIPICLLVLVSCCVLVACGSNVKLTINFDSKGGTYCRSIKYEVGKSFNMPAEPTKENYIFGGWFTDDGVWEKEFTVNTVLNYPLSRDMSITVYAKWMKKAHLVFDSNGGSVCDEIFLNQSGTALPTPTKEDYIFKGWYLDNNSFENEYKLGDDVALDAQNCIKVYAKWEYAGQQLEVRTAYYACEKQDLQKKFTKTYDTVTQQASLKLYTPKILGQDFRGWYLDKAFTQPVGEYLSFNDIDSEDRYTILYAKFKEKEVDSLTMVGSIKNEYEYGEEFDANGAKIRVVYKDKNYADEIIDLTKDLLPNFKTIDETSTEGLIYIGEYYIIGTNPIQERDYHQLSTSFSVNNASISITYKVKTDLKTLSINDENLVFTHGDDATIKGKNIVADWEKLDGQTGQAWLEDGKNGTWSEPVTQNCTLTSITTINYGNFTGYIRFRFKMIKVGYKVLPNDNIAYAEERNSIGVIINSNTSLMDLSVAYYDSVANKWITWSGISHEAIVKDIDSSTAGNQQAIILYNGKEIPFNYYVIDEQNIKFIHVEQGMHQYEENHDTHQVTILFVMEDGTYTYYRVTN